MEKKDLNEIQLYIMIASGSKTCVHGKYATSCSEIITACCM